MTPEDAREYISEHSGIELVESDLEPEDARQGRAQFLVSLIASKENIEKDLADTELELFNVGSAPDHFFHIALPPE